MFTKQEMKVLEKLSRKLIGMPYAMLPREERDFICCEAYERGLL